MIFKKFRVFIYFWRINYFQKRLIQKIIKFSKTKKGIIFKDEVSYLINNGLTVFPYSFSRKYNAIDIEIKYNEDLPYILYSGKKLFFPEKFSEKKISEYCRGLFSEQDKLSPHSYRNNLFFPEINDVMLDIGCAEGNYSLEIVDEVNKVYLYEMNSYWVKPLKNTFDKWQNKVEIVNKEFNKNLADEIRSKGYNSIFFKIDVDGAEMKVISFIETLILNTPIVKVAICTYHKNGDADLFQEWFKSRGFEISFNDGYMLFYYDRKIKQPFFRKGVLFAYKS